LNWEDQADAFESEDGGADGEREVARVKEFDGGVEAAAGEYGGDVVPVDVGQAD